MAVTKKGRALVAIINVQDNVPKNVRWLYQFIDASGAIASDLLAVKYGKYQKLYGGNATRARFVNALKNLGEDASVKALDVLVMIHGLDGKLVFADATCDTAELSAEIRALDLSNKLRLLYSTACYGFSHTGDFINAGFSAAVGAKKVNANAASEVPVLFSMWAAGSRLKDAVAKGDSSVTRRPADKAAQWFGRINKTAWRDDVNSEKVIIGSNGVTITSES
ncbi:MAG TPA: hypothetical protein VK400_09705 [Pyrinomonadaceae bacterium]|nr:hypothetical protein [Pyrinomonadaceae bacterium]